MALAILGAWQGSLIVQKNVVQNQNLEREIDYCPQMLEDSRALVEQIASLDSSVLLVGGAASPFLQLLHEASREASGGKRNQQK